MRALIRLCGAVLWTLAGAAGPVWAADPALPYGINAHLASGALLDRVAAAGIAWVRVDFNWWMMEPARGTYDWARTDAVVADARARGLHLYATLAYTPAWANGGQSPNTPPVDPQDWYAFVFTTVSRYRGRIRHWGLWNEPNLKHFFSGSPAQYIDAILRVGAQAVRDADPDGTVLGPELAQEDGWAAWLYAVLDQAAEALDIVTMHSYQDTGHDVLQQLGGPGPPQPRPTVHDVMRATGTVDKALWLTETGWNTADVSEEVQATNVEQVLAGVEGKASPDKVFFYQLVDEPGSPDEWGILRVDLSPKLAYDVYQSHIAAQGSAAARPLARPPDSCAGSSAGRHAVRLSRPSSIDACGSAGISPWAGTSRSSPERRRSGSREESCAVCGIHPSRSTPSRVEP